MKKKPCRTDFLQTDAITPRGEKEEEKTTAMQNSRS